MNIVVTDANILIDLCELDILEEFFSLPYSMSVVGAVWDELSDEQIHCWGRLAISDLTRIASDLSLSILQPLPEHVLTLTVCSKC